MEIDPFTIDKKSVSAPADIKVMIDFLTTEVNTQNLDDLGKLVLDGALMLRLKRYCWFTRLKA